ncbi:hypothetical protein [Nocardia donostiensis]|uniref:Uncharacterized protein n=1 Tax=Nocardia donostiensis TaxID=1538463 RepID=A0A1W0BHX1_9NOCA|nr:hypothetical protein [Nocardia donostiensis]ONM49905.1 hypothetical protein B0T46_05895 [Nocardia donostiensis]OQS22145.1 hypothetical protein B0T44_05645 [Nocardia donostiensis]
MEHHQTQQQCPATTDDARGIDVGYIRRDFYFDEQGRTVVHNENIYLDDDAHGQGFGGVLTVLGHCTRRKHR